MSEAESGVTAKMQAVEHRAVFTQCYGHALNLACADTIRQLKLMRDAHDTTHQAIERRDDTPGVRVLFPTRWTVKAESLNRILENLTVLLSLLDESLKVV